MTWGAAAYVKSGSGAMGYKSTTGAMIFKGYVIPLYTYSRAKRGEHYVTRNDATWEPEANVFPTAQSNMEASLWQTYADQSPKIQTVKQTLSGNYRKTYCFAQASAHCYPVDAVGVYGKTCTAVKITVTNANALDFRINIKSIAKVNISDGTDTYSNWSYVHDDAQYVGNDTGTLLIPVDDLVMDGYLLVMAMFDDPAAPVYADPPPDGNTTYDVTLTQGITLTLEP